MSSVKTNSFFARFTIKTFRRPILEFWLPGVILEVKANNSMHEKCPKFSSQAKKCKSDY